MASPRSHGGHCEVTAMRTEDLLIILFCEVDDWVRQHGVPARPGPVPACADSEVLTFALARELLGYDSERRFRRVLRDDWGHLFPRIPAQSELNRRTRWLWGALEQLRRHYAARLPPATEDWYAFDTTPLPVKHPVGCAARTNGACRAGWWRASAGARPRRCGSTASGWRCSPRSSIRCRYAGRWCRRPSTNATCCRRSSRPPPMAGCWRTRGCVARPSRRIWRGGASSC